MCTVQPYFFIISTMTGCVSYRAALLCFLQVLVSGIFSIVIKIFFAQQVKKIRGGLRVL